MRKKLSRRKRWLLATLGGLLAVCALLIWNQQELSVVVYNNTDHAFENVTVSAGAQIREIPALGAKESMSFSFNPVSLPTDLSLLIGGDFPLRWSAPGMASPSISRVTIRVDEFGGVTTTIERSWGSQLSSWLE